MKSSQLMMTLNLKRIKLALRICCEILNKKSFAYLFAFVSKNTISYITDDNSTYIIVGTGLTNEKYGGRG